MRRCLGGRNSLGLSRNGVNVDYINDFCRRYDEAWACGYSEFFENADLCNRFYRGDRISLDDISKAEASGRILRAFNHLCPKLNALSGLLQGTDYRAVPNVEYGNEELRNTISLKDKTNGSYPYNKTLKIHHKQSFCTLSI